MKNLCIHNGICGGCSLGYLDLNDYKSKKYQPLIDYFSQFIETKVIYIGDKSRRRCSFKILNKNLGFMMLNSNNITQVKECLILTENLSNLISPINLLLKKTKSKIISIDLSEADNGVDIDFNIEGDIYLMDREQILNFATKNNINRVMINGSAEYIFKNSIIEINNKKIVLPEKYFLQASKKCMDIIIKSLVKNHNSKACVLDLFSGCGFYSFSLDNYKKILALELSEKMVSSISQNAKALKLLNLQTRQRDLFKYPLKGVEMEEFSDVIINPPRKGARAICENITAGKRISIISCNPDSFKIDMKILLNKGYKIEELIIIDQFYWSEHVEIYGFFNTISR